MSATDKRTSELTDPVSIDDTDYLTGYRPGTSGNPNLDIKAQVQKIRAPILAGLAAGTVPVAASGVQYSEGALGTDSALRTAVERARDRPHVFDFIPSGQQAAILARTSDYECSADLNKAVTQAVGIAPLDFAYGVYKLGAPLTVPTLAHLRGAHARTTTAGGAAVILQYIGSGMSAGDSLVDCSSQSVVTLEGLVIDGLSSANGLHGLLPPSVSLDMFNCQIRRCDRGIRSGASTYMKNAHLYGVKFDSNNTAVYGAIDSRLESCHGIANAQFGLYLPTGASNNQIVACKWDWNGVGIYNKGNNNTVVAGNIDRNTTIGMGISGAVQTMVTGTMFYRNGRSGTTGGENCCHILIEGNARGVSIAGISTRIGGDDNPVQENFTTTTASYTQPTIGSTVDIPMASVSGLAVNSFITVNGDNQYVVTAINSLVVTSKLLAGGSSPAAAGATVASGVAVSDFGYAGARSSVVFGDCSDVQVVGCNLSGFTDSVVDYVSGKTQQNLRQAANTPGFQKAPVAIPAGTTYEYSFEGPPIPTNATCEYNLTFGFRNTSTGARYRCRYPLTIYRGTGNAAVSGPSAVIDEDTGAAALGLAAASRAVTISFTNVAADGSKFGVTMAPVGVSIKGRVHAVLAGSG